MVMFSIGDRVRIDIPDHSDLDHKRFHGKHGEIIEIIKDDASNITKRNRDNTLYRVELDSDDVMDFREQDLRPPIKR